MENSWRYIKGLFAYCIEPLWLEELFLQGLQRQQEEVECRVCRLLFPSVVKIFWNIKPIFSLTNKYPTQKKVHFCSIDPSMDLDITRKKVHVCPIQNSKYKKKWISCPQPKGKAVYTLHRQGGRRSCSQLLSRLQRHTQANVALNLSVWKSFCIASRFFFHSYPVTSIMNLNLALWYVLGGYASQEAGRDQRIRWTCIWSY